VDLHLHAKNIPLKPTELLDLSRHGSSSSPLSTSRSTRPRISHEGTRISSGRGRSLLLLDIMLLDGVQHTIITKIILRKGMLDEEHDVRSIWKSVPLNDSILNLMKDKIHHIKGEILIRVGRSGTLMSKEEKVYKRGADGIIVTTTWSNVLSENVDKLIIE
jgi:hypothetical protein